VRRVLETAGILGEAVVITGGMDDERLKFRDCSRAAVWKQADVRATPF